MCYQYGVSFNCVVEVKGKEFDTDIGGGRDGYTSTDFVGNNIEKLGVAAIANAFEEGYSGGKVSTTHQLVGGMCSASNHDGKVVAIVLDMFETEDESEASVVAVIFKYPDLPTIVED